MYLRRGKTFAVRTIRNGRVKIGKQWFYPDPKWLEYDGRLDGMRFAFGRYWRMGMCNSWRTEPYVFLWGPEENYRERDTTKWIDDPQIVDGTMPWTWWRTKPA